ncbi:hypothetical protein ACI780_06895 [Geodermatophilus sp. SYSU D00814]
MPLALLLQNAAWTLATAASTLTPWLEIVARESVVVERARSAFLVHWFGERVPFAGLSLRAYVTNLGALDAQFLLAQRSVVRSTGGPNPTSAVLGLAGSLAGTLISPVGALVGARLLLRFGTLTVGTALKALLWALAPWLLAAGLVAAPCAVAVLLGGGLVLAGLGYGLAAVLGGRRELQAAYDLFGALGCCLHAAAGLLNQLSGPRAGVRNPLLLRLLRLLDRSAALYAQALGAVAVLLTRIGPVLPSVAETARGLLRLVRAAVPVLEDVVLGLLGRLTELREGPLSLRAVVDRVAAVARGRFRQVRRVFSDGLALLRAMGADLLSSLDDTYSRLQDLAVAFVEVLFTGHPTARLLKAFRTQLSVVTQAFATAPESSSSSSGPSPLSELLDQLDRAVPPWPDFPELPELPDADRLRRSLGTGVPPLSGAAIEAAADRLGSRSGPEPPIQLGTEAASAVRRAAERPSVLRRERQAFEERFGAAPGRAVRLSRAGLDPVRAAFTVVVGRVLPPAMRAGATAQLAGVLATLDADLYAGPQQQLDPETLPVLDLPADDRLRTEVRTLRLRLPGTTVGEARRFEELLRRRLGQVAPAAAGG